MENKKIKICFFTGTRAEYGLLKHLMMDISKCENFILQILVSGTHLSKHHGYTISEIINDGFKIDAKLDLDLKEDSNNSTCQSLSKVISKVSDSLNFLRPDLMILLGDRYELIGAALSALINRIPIAHIHGGEITEGAFDDNIRHAITKLSHIHFVANSTYKKRVIQLGESPHNVFEVGGLGIDAIKRINLLRKDNLEKELDIKFMKKNLIITYHPATLESSNQTKYEIKELIHALSRLKDTLQIFTMPNADPGHKEIFEIINSYVQINKNAVSFNSLGQLNYLSCLAQVDAVVGNSSSGIIEAPSFNIGTINIGDRQKGRLRANSVIDVEGNEEMIIKSLNKIYSTDFKESLKFNKNPYGAGNASHQILSILQSYNLNDILKKSFQDIEFDFYDPNLN